MKTNGRLCATTHVPVWTNRFVSGGIPGSANIFRQNISCISSLYIVCTVIPVPVINDAWSKNITNTLDFTINFISVNHSKLRSCTCTGNCHFRGNLIIVEPCSNRINCSLNISHHFRMMRFIGKAGIPVIHINNRNIFPFQPENIYISI